MRHRILPARAHGVLRGAAILFLVAVAGCAMAPEPEVVQPGGVVLTDPMVAGIFTTANQGEIQQAQLALSKSTNPAVRQFAQRMINDHTMANQRTTALMDRLGTGTAMSPTSQQLETSARQTMEALQGYQGADFDRAYIQNQVELHRWLLQMLDTTLIPAARNNDLERLLRDVRPTVADHLREAQQIQMSLQRQ